MLKKGIKACQTRIQYLGEPSFNNKEKTETSLVVRWLGAHLPGWDTFVQRPGREWGCHVPWGSWAHTPRLEKPAPRNCWIQVLWSPAPQQRGPHPATRKPPACRNWTICVCHDDPAQPKLKTKIKTKQTFLHKHWENLLLTDLPWENFLKDRVSIFLLLSPPNWFQRQANLINNCKTAM